MGAAYVEMNVVLGLMRAEAVPLVQRFSPETGVLAFMPDAPANEGIALSIRHPVVAHDGAVNEYKQRSGGMKPPERCYLLFDGKANQS